MGCRTKKLDPMDSGPFHDGRNDRRTDSAEYIALEMSRLARMADANGFGLLAYLIDMAVLEAWREASEPDGSTDGRGGR